MRNETTWKEGLVLEILSIGVMMWERGERREKSDKFRLSSAYPAVRRRLDSNSSYSYGNLFSSNWVIGKMIGLVVLQQII